MNQLRKTKKIEIEIYEDEEADFLLSLMNLSKDDACKYLLISKIVPKSIDSQTIYNMCGESYVKGYRFGLKSFWRYFKTSAKNNNSRFYLEMTGETYNQFHQREISILLSLIFGLFNTFKELSKNKTIEANFLSLLLTNFIFNKLVLYDALMKLQGEENEDKISKIMILSNIIGLISRQDNKYLHQYSTIETVFKIPISRNFINNYILILMEFLEKGQTTKEIDEVQNYIIENLYEEVKKHYQFTDHAIFTIIGYVLATIGLLKNQEEHDSDDKRQTWREYLKNSVSNRVKSKLLLNSKNIEFVGKPLHEFPLSPVPSESKFLIRQAIRHENNSI